jgi:hypothetical protein
MFALVVAHTRLRWSPAVTCGVSISPAPGRGLSPASEAAFDAGPVDGAAGILRGKGGVMRLREEDDEWEDDDDFDDDEDDEDEEDEDEDDDEEWNAGEQGVHRLVTSLTLR